MYWLEDTRSAGIGSQLFVQSRIHHRLLCCHISHAWDICEVLWALPITKRTDSSFNWSASHSAFALQSPARVIAVTPTDQFRFGYRLWLDEKTAMPLKTQLCDASGQVIEQIFFARLDMPDNIPDSDLVPAVRTEGMRWVRQGPSHESAPPALSAFRANELPPGFRLTVEGAQTIGGATVPASHLVYSDGLATVSVFVEAQPTEAPGAGVAAAAGPVPAEPPMQGLARVGSGFAYSTVVQGHQVTAVGEVPAQTVEFIAHSVRSSGSVELPRH